MKIYVPFCVIACVEKQNDDFIGHSGKYMLFIAVLCLGTWFIRLFGQKYFDRVAFYLGLPCLLFAFLFSWTQIEKNESPSDCSSRSLEKNHQESHKGIPADWPINNEISRDTHDIESHSQ